MPSAPSTIDPQWTLAHLSLLSEFSKRRPAEPALPGHWADRWREALGESEEQAIRRFVEAGLLTRCSLSERLDWKVRYVELKQMLKERGLKPSGNKVQLIERLCQADPKGMETAVAGVNLLRCSEAGQDLASSFIASREHMRNAALNALCEGELDSAVRTVCDFHDALGFPEDLFFPTKPNLSDLRRAFSVRPTILAGVTDETLEELRVAAGMAFLGLGTDWLPDNFETGIRLKGDAAVRMIISRVQNERNMQAWLESGLVKTIKVLCSQDGPCEACSALSNRAWQIESLPEIPYMHCTSEQGCRCVCVADSIESGR